ncbi:MAG TPA: hypothetical protein VF608_13970 [Thermoanaerobaculia bacterium]
MILYRKASPLRIRRSPIPEPPFWPATIVAPYAAKRTTPIAIDYPALRASGAEKLEVNVADHVRDELERARNIAGPVLIDAAESCEIVFRRGEEALQWCEDESRAALFLTSTPPSRTYEHATIVIAAWPLRFTFDSIASPWGVAIPIIYPHTTDVAVLERLADAVHAAGASFFAPIPIELEPTAKQAIASSMQLTADDDRYAMLFHAPLEPLQLATERHIAALASERGMHDFVVPPRWEERSNWNAAVLLSLTASRMIAMELDLDLAGSIARSARVIAELDKPIARIAESARIGIIGGIDETSTELLEEWMRGDEPSFAAFVNEQWRLKRL